MSSKIIKPYFGPADFRMMREILRRAGYRLYDTAENRAAHLVAAKLLIQEFQSGRSQSRGLSKLSRRYATENMDGSPGMI
jgi:arginyl-tRNA--protein-N-Asp/Glu arginylyltransferase